MVKLPPSEFTYGKYNLNTIPNDVQMMNTKGFVKWLKEQNIIGYIEGLELEIRPRNAYGVMIEDEDGFVSWAHIHENVWKRYLKETIQ